MWTSHFRFRSFLLSSFLFTSRGLAHLFPALSSEKTRLKFFDVTFQDIFDEVFLQM